MKNKENEITDLNVDVIDQALLDYNKNENNKYFPFQTQTQIDVTPESCPIQKRFKKLGLTSKTHKSFDNVVKKLNERLITLYPRQSACAKKEIHIIKNNLQFLESNRSFVFQFAKTYLDWKTYSFLYGKNLDVLFRQSKLSHLKNKSALTLATAVYFYPNQLGTETINTQANGRPIMFQTKRKSSSRKLIMDNLKFFYVDIDNAGSYEDVDLKIKKFGLEPDIIVQTSENGFHLYWSINCVCLDTYAEDKNGNQLDSNLILYELGLKSLIAEFRADPSRSNASSLLRMPNTWNIKKRKNRKFKTKYLENSRTLEEALKEPRYKFNEIIEHISKHSNSQIYGLAAAQIKFRKISSLKNEDNSTKSDEQIEALVTDIKKKVEFDFNAGWDEALSSLCKFFNIDQSYFSHNDLIVLKHMWTYRLCKKLNFPKSIRKLLKGSGEKYSELNFSIDKISSLPKKIKSRVKLIELVEQYKRAGRGSTGVLNGYKASELFLEACGCKHNSHKKDWLSIVTNTLYTNGKRNEAMSYDCFILHKLLQFSKNEALALLIDKVDRSAKQSDESLRCSNDISNVEAWLNYFYK
jgi:hypothetical protein